MTILKSIVVCLALANVGYFLWTRGVASEGGAAPAASTLRLASETSAPARAASGTPRGGSTAVPVGESAAPAPHDESPAALLTSVKRCVSVGPFRDVAEVAHAASTLRSGGYDPRQRVEDGEVWAGVWVYLPLPASRAATDQMLAKLKSGGIEDALEMPGPADASVISLGLFGEQKRADSRIAQAQALGFNPGITERKRTGNVYWIDIDLKPTDSVMKPVNLTGEAGRIVRLEVKGCPAEEAASP